MSGRVDLRGWLLEVSRRCFTLDTDTSSRIILLRLQLLQMKSNCTYTSLTTFLPQRASSFSSPSGSKFIYPHPLSYSSSEFKRICTKHYIFIFPFSSWSGICIIIIISFFIFCNKIFTFIGMKRYKTDNRQNITSRIPGGYSTNCEWKCIFYVNGLIRNNVYLKS